MDTGPLVLTPTDPASSRLAQADPELGALIDRVERVELAAPGDPFEELVSSIVAQQLSDKVVRTIWARVVQVAAPTPEGFAGADFDALRAAGLSRSKVDYVQGVARAVLAGEINLNRLADLDDEQVIGELIRLRGVGRWTAEMFLIFALRRPDVLAVDDYGIRAAAGRLLGLDRVATRDEVLARGELWRPHRSVASLWLWASSS